MTDKNNQSMESDACWSSIGFPENVSTGDIVSLTGVLSTVEQLNTEERRYALYRICI